MPAKNDDSLPNIFKHKHIVNNFRVCHDTQSRYFFVKTISLLRNYIRCKAISNPNIAPNVLDALASYPSKNVRKLVGRNPNTSSATLEKLAQDQNESVRKIYYRECKYPILHTAMN